MALPWFSGWTAGLWPATAAGDWNKCAEGSLIWDLVGAFNERFYALFPYGDGSPQMAFPQPGADVQRTGNPASWTTWKDTHGAWPASEILGMNDGVNATRFSFTYLQWLLVYLCGRQAKNVWDGFAVDSAITLQGCPNATPPFLTFARLLELAGLNPSGFTRHYPREITTLGAAGQAGWRARLRGNGLVYTHDGTSWTSPSAGAVPDMLTAYGYFAAGDCIGPHLFNELKAAILAISHTALPVILRDWEGTLRWYGSATGLGRTIAEAQTNTTWYQDTYSLDQEEPIEIWSAMRRSDTYPDGDYAYRGSREWVQARAAVRCQDRYAWLEHEEDYGVIQVPILSVNWYVGATPKPVTATGSGTATATFNAQGQPVLERAWAHMSSSYTYELDEGWQLFSPPLFAAPSSAVKPAWEPDLTLGAGDHASYGFSAYGDGLEWGEGGWAVVEWQFAHT